MVGISGVPRVEETETVNPANIRAAIRMPGRGEEDLSTSDVIN
jgi:hypothetical protein